MKTLSVTTKLPGGRKERESLSYDEVFDLLVECSPNAEAVETAMKTGMLRVQEISYAWEPSEELFQWAREGLAALPGPEPERPFAPERCQVVTFSFNSPTEESLEQLRPSQGVSFHKKDLEGPNLSVRGVGRGQLEPALWEYILFLPSSAGVRYQDFHLGNGIDRYRVHLHIEEVRLLLARLEQSAYRPAREMIDYLLYHRPTQIDLYYSCERP